jgi:PleD family two-component response regulator
MCRDTRQAHFPWPSASARLYTACFKQCYNKSRMSQYVIAAVDDMFFASKIRAAAEHLAVEVRFVRSADALVAAARGAVPPALIIFDLHSQRCEPFSLAGRLKADEHARSIPLLGFFSHVQTALARKAEEAGFDRVMPRSAFTRHLSEILQQTKFPEA